MLRLVYSAHHRQRNSNCIRLAKHVVTGCAHNNPLALKIKDQVTQPTGTIDEGNRLFKIAPGNMFNNHETVKATQSALYLYISGATQHLFSINHK